ncbi:MAG: hypothetical protein LBG28_12655 [Tannerella sp.]|jgi:hypothetical protein|nr:hypothetical protein [Tannerella sp.]
MKYQEWQKKAPRFVAMTGYTKEKFNELLPYFKEAHDEYLSEYRMDGKRRSGLRAYTMYANSPPPCIMEERLAFILSYLKLNPIQEAHRFYIGAGHRLSGIPSGRCYCHSTGEKTKRKGDNGGTETGQPHNFFFQSQSGTCHREH